MSALARRVLRVVLVVLGCAAALALVFAVLLDEPGPPPPPIVVAENDALGEDLVAFGRSVEVIGNVRGSVVALGGDVCVSGSIEGDVASLGGSVFQQDGSRITGDVIVLDGRYEHGSGAGLREPHTNTVIYAVGSQSLRDFFANPARELLAPRIDRAYVGWRLVAAIFSFVVALGVVALAPGAVGRASERLATDSLRIAAIGLVGTVAAILLTGLVLVLLPGPFAVLASILLLLALIVVQVFGRVVAYFLVGRWLQRRLFGEKSRSQTIALVLGVMVFALLGSLPIVGALLLFAIFILSTGIILTAPARVG